MRCAPTGSESGTISGRLSVVSMSGKHRKNQVRSLDPQKPQVVAGQRTETTAWSGPLPPPEALQQFDRVIPGGAARILQMAESEQTHRISFEQTALNAAIADKKRGQYFGGSIGVLAIAGAVVTANYGAPWQVPVALVGVPVLGIVQALIGRSGKSKDA